MTLRSSTAPLPVTLRQMAPGGDADQLFLLPDFGGGVLYASRLARRLDGAARCMGARFSPDMIETLDKLSLEDVAARFAADILASQPTGRVHLLGFSFAGVLAFETARRLFPALERPGRVFILDSNIHRMLPGFSFWSEPASEARYAASFAARNWARLAGLRAEPHILHRYGRARLDLSRHSEAHRRIIRTTYDMLGAYRPTPFPCAATVFRAGRERRWRHLPDDLGWRALTGPETNAFSVPATHLGMVEDADATALIATRLREQMAAPPAGGDDARYV